MITQTLADHFFHERRRIKKENEIKLKLNKYLISDKWRRFNCSYEIGIDSIVIDDREILFWYIASKQWYMDGWMKKTKVLTKILKS